MNSFANRVGKIEELKVPRLRKENVSPVCDDRCGTNLQSRSKNWRVVDEKTLNNR